MTAAIHIVDTWAPEADRPLWVKLIGCGKHAYNGPKNSFRTWWGEFSPQGWGIGIEVGSYGTAHLNIMHLKGQSFIRLPFLDRWFKERYDGCSLNNPRFGFSWTFAGSGDHPTLRVSWMRKSTSFDMPWQWRYWSREYLGQDGEWHVTKYARLDDGGKVEEPVQAPAWSEQHSYHYMLDNGVVQEVVATIERTRCKREWLWFGEKGWLNRLLRKVSPSRQDQYIDIQFSDEVGARRGSWKGGTIGCAWEMRPGETPREALRRMQRERRFR